VKTITQRPRPQHRGNESAAIALTAQLLSGLKTGAAEAIYLIPSAGPLRYSEFFDNYAESPSGSSFQRRHDGTHGTTWFGTERQIDQHGRTWQRSYKAVIDDFGNLVEVSA